MTIMDYAIYGTLAIIVFGFLGYVMYMRSFNWTVYVKEIVHGGQKKFSVDKGKIFYDEQEKSKFLKLWRSKDPLLGNKKAVIPLPPEDAIYFGTHGQNVVELYKTQQGLYAYAIDKETGKPILDENGEQVIKDFKMYSKYNAIIDKTIVPEIEPFTTEQRMIYARRMEKAYARKKNGWSEVLQQAAVPLILGIIVIALLAFYADMGKPLLEMADKVNENERLQTEQLQIVKDINSNVQRITGNSEQVKPPSPVPPSPNGK
jgi:hypothetical protein